MKPTTNTNVAADGRRDSRQPLTGEVTITFAADPIHGPGQNISTQGLYFTAQGALRVLVRIEGRAEPVPAELVRAESMGNGRIGIAVRFLEPMGG
jgi:hypothetical protein